MAVEPAVQAATASVCAPTRDVKLLAALGKPGAVGRVASPSRKRQAELPSKTRPAPPRELPVELQVKEALAASDVVLDVKVPSPDDGMELGSDSCSLCSMLLTRCCLRCIMGLVLIGAARVLGRSFLAAQG
eukprot:TRINITY_DN15040_c0_g1_i1.p1 TRINITY_DN15040_c0_g1~~TRINITY_DN15040_c0_g1_i1.p1  ORF type:complete len:139 (-),score=24.88 TRINITY_DN15040_c0_g1_i1:136-528(-)